MKLLESRISWASKGISVIAIICSLALSVISCLSSPAVADSQDVTVTTDTLETVASAKLGFANRSLIVAPIPLKNPTLGSGVILTSGYLLKFDEKSDTSFIGLAGMRTSNGSMGAGVAANLYFGQGRWKIESAYGKANVNYDLYGFGNVSLKPAQIIQDGEYAKLQLSYGITDKFSAGIGANYLSTTIKLRSGSSFPIEGLPGFGVKVREILVGPTLDWDTRDDTMYPTTGLHGTLDIQKGIGLGAFNNEFVRTVAVGQSFNPIGKNGVLAINGSVCSISGRTPFFNQCTVGGTDALRGYPVGQFIDKALVSFQAEGRFRLTQRLGVVVFGGASAVGPKLSKINGSNLLYAGGGGVRFRLSKEYPLDFSIDGSVNKSGEKLVYIRVGQSF